MTRSAIDKILQNTRNTSQLYTNTKMNNMPPSYHKNTEDTKLCITWTRKTEK